MPPKEARPKVQTTLRLPRPLYEQAKSLVRSGMSSAQNINELMVAALRAYVNMLRRRQIDAAFRGMADDESFQKLANHLAEEFQESDRESLDLAEKASRPS